MTRRELCIAACTNFVVSPHRSLEGVQVWRTSYVSSPFVAGRLGLITSSKWRPQTLDRTQREMRPRVQRAHQGVENAVKDG